MEDRDKMMITMGDFTDTCDYLGDILNIFCHELCQIQYGQALVLTLLYHNINSVLLQKITSLTFKRFKVCQGQYAQQFWSILGQLTHLTHLSLIGTQLTNENIEKLVSVPMVCLNSLNLSYNQIGSQCIKLIASSHTLTNLTSLNLNYTSIDNDSILTLSISPAFNNLTSLSLSDNKIDNEAAIAIAQSSILSNLIELNLGGNKISHVGVESIAVSTQLLNLQNLNLSSNLIGNHGAEVLAQSSTLSKLTHLYLSNTGIGDEGAVLLLGKSSKLTQLELVDVSYNKIYDPSTITETIRENLPLAKVIISKIFNPPIGR